ncbi:hypothetical protein QJS10_CPA01g00969 [Acorus calamus]|uniref:Uncharacterized protein n=1 Tax=Acorus calamus TaxID=4465 RepID=A0AAV9FGX7_ACOCL|nr:hypothetical protein QJS10_CPA01g00969 [Acorus calamus]
MRFGRQGIDMTKYFTAPIDGEKVSLVVMDKDEDMVEDEDKDKSKGKGRGNGIKRVTCIRILDNKVKNFNKLLQDLKQDYSVNGVVVKGTDSPAGATSSNPIGLQHIELEGDRLIDALNFLIRHCIITVEDFSRLSILRDSSSSEKKKMPLTFNWGILIKQQ